MFYNNESILTVISLFLVCIFIILIIITLFYFFCIKKNTKMNELLLKDTETERSSSEITVKV